MAAQKPDTDNKAGEQPPKRNGVMRTGASGQPAANDAAKFRLYPTQE